MYADRTPPGKPPCDTCRVELLDSNTDVADVFMLSRGQVITAGERNMPIDISIPAIKAVMDMDRKQRRDLMRVQNLWHHFNNEREEE